MRAEVAAETQFLQAILTGPRPNLEEAEKAASRVAALEKMVALYRPPQVDTSLITLALAQAVSLLGQAASELHVARPAYLAELDRWQALPAHVKLRADVRPPGPGPDDTDAEAAANAAQAELDQWQANVAVVMTDAGRPGANISDSLAACSDLLDQAAHLGETVAAANAMTTLADSNRAQLGLTWQAPAW
jgi:hypothetical protein